jgi:outer membrane protein assembly factor BamA
MQKLSLIFVFFVFANFCFAQEMESPEPAESLSEAVPPKEDYSKKLILLPIAYYTPETKFAGGLLAIKNLWKEKEGHTSNIMTTASVTFNNQVMASIAPRLYFQGGEWELGGVFFYSYFPNKYYGRGTENSLSSPEKYTENSFILAVSGGKNIYERLFIRGGFGQDLRKIIDYQVGGEMEKEIQNIAQSLQVLSLNIGLEWDERDYPQAPRQGSWYRVTQSFYDPKDREGGKDLDHFRKIEFDLRQYVTLAPRWVAAGQLVASEVQGDQVPFQYLNSIGGGSRMRGFYAGQYRDKALGMFQAELRFEKNIKWTPAIFAGVARIATKISDLNKTDSFYSGGAGIHYTIDPENRTKLRLDLGLTNKESGAYFLIGEAF